MSDRFQYHRQLYGTLQRTVSAFLQQDPDHDAQGREEIAAMLRDVEQALNECGDYDTEGQRLLCRLISHFPALTPHIERDLLWFFGGDCLHYLSDEEIARFQQLDELAHASPGEDYAEVRARVFALH